MNHLNSLDGICDVGCVDSQKRSSIQQSRHCFCYTNVTRPVPWPDRNTMHTLHDLQEHAVADGLDKTGNTLAY